MTQITLLDFLAECLKKNGHNVSTYHLSDNSGSGITIRKQHGDKAVDISLNFNSNGTELQDVEAHRVIFTGEDHERIF